MTNATRIPAASRRLPRPRHRTSVLGSAALLLCLAPLLAGVLPAPAQASPVEIVRAVFDREGGTWQVSVTLRHADTGWEHYANLWIVETLDGRELGRRVLFHPHETEQPFTRSAQIAIPKGITQVRVRAGDNVDGLSAEGLSVDLTQPHGSRYEVR